MSSKILVYSFITLFTSLLFFSFIEDNNKSLPINQNLSNLNETNKDIETIFVKLEVMESNLSNLNKPLPGLQEINEEIEPVAVKLEVMESNLSNLNKNYLVIGLVDSNISLYTRSRYSAIDILKANSLEVIDDYGLSYPTLMLAENWFKDEGTKYGKETNIQFEIVGPYVFNATALPNNPTLPDFKEVIERNKILLEDYDGIIILFFHGEKAQRISYQVGNFSYIDLQFSDISFDMINIVKTIMHESTHMLGAYDLYSNRGFSCDMELGVPEPEKGYNQTKACIMCGAIAITSEYDGKEGMQGITRIDEIVLCNETARQINWTK